jgi:hypothetical protein
MRIYFPFLFFSLVMAFSVKGQTPIYSFPAFQLYQDRVVQGSFEAKALSPFSLKSNYQSPANAFQPAELIFKFAINGRDNEMPPGMDHRFVLPNGKGPFSTPLVRFGQVLKPGPEKPGFLQPNTPVKIRLDFREQKKMLEEQGYLLTYQGTRISKSDFKGIFIAGASSPLTWDFDNLDRKKEFQLQDPDGDGIYELDLVFNTFQENKGIASSWFPRNDLSSFPKLESPWLLSDALYNLALDEMQTAIEPDSTFRTGKEWAGVWTRDISYSILLSMAVLQPDVAKISLKKKVKNKRVIQDTGTGGAWPVSTDRMIWAVAAWEIYKVTGDKEWLIYATEVVRNSVEDDLKTAWDPATGLVLGESSFLDWREQTYPRWMQPADIYQSACLGTNAAHFQCWTALSAMLRELGNSTESIAFQKRADQLKKAIQERLWMKEKGYFGQFEYGRNARMVSPKSEALGEALCVWFGIADPVQARAVVENTPVVPFGIPCIFPQIPQIPPYHNRAVWPFVQSYWALAAAKTGNETSLMESIAAIYRPAALFLTNKENFVSENGDYAGTVINSSNMLWSLSGSLALVYRIFFGIQFEPGGLRFQPMVPRQLDGKRTLKNFKYRKAILDLEVNGSGNQVEGFLLDGKVLPQPFLPANLEGRHLVQIKLKTGSAYSGKTGMQPDQVSPETPVCKLEKRNLVWQPVEKAIHYEILWNGRPWKKTETTALEIPPSVYGELSVVAVDGSKRSSFASEPLWLPGTPGPDVEIPLTSGSQLYTEIQMQDQQPLRMEINLEQPGQYAVAFQYANGNGPVNTENKCAIRHLKFDQKDAGTVVFPQRGIGEWSNLGMTNWVDLPKCLQGKHVLELSLQSWNANMHGEVNQARLYKLVIRKKASLAID